MSRAELESLLGEPEVTGVPQSRKNRRPLIWKYGDVEFIFDHYWQDVCGWHEGKLVSLYMDYFDSGAPQGWGGLELEPWIVRNGLPLAQFEDAVAQLGFGYRIEPGDEPSVTRVLLQSGVTAEFEQDEDTLTAPGLFNLGRTLGEPRLP